MAVRSPLGKRLLGHKTDNNNNEAKENRTRLPMLRGLSLSPRSSPRRTSIENGEKRSSRRRIIHGSMPGSMEIGLENLGNTCFMNSSLQCLLHIQPLVSYFLANENNLLLNKKSPTKGLLASSFAQLVKEISNAQAGSVIAPIDFQKVVCRHAPHLLDNQQQDCQEFLHFLLDGMSEDLCRDKRTVPISNTNSTLDLTVPLTLDITGLSETSGTSIPSQQVPSVSRKKNGEKLTSSRTGSGRISQSLSFTEGITEDTLVFDDNAIPSSSSKITAAQRLREQIALANGNIVSPVHLTTNDIDAASPESNNNGISAKNRGGFHHPQRVRRPGHPPGSIEKGSSYGDMTMAIESPNQSPPIHSSPYASSKLASRKDPGSPMLDLALAAGVIGHSTKAGSSREMSTSGSLPNSSRKLSPRLGLGSPRTSTGIHSPFSLTQKDTTTSKDEIDKNKKEERDKGTTEVPVTVVAAVPPVASTASTPRKGMRLKFPNINLRSIAIGSREGVNSHSAPQAAAAAASVPESDSSDGMTRPSLFGKNDGANVNGITSSMATAATLSPEQLQKSRQVALEQSKKSWDGYLAMNDSVVTDIFAGQLQSTIECLTCHHRSFCFDSFLDLSVPIPKGPDVVPVKSTWRRSTTISPAAEPTKCPLEECIAKFAGEEILDGENMFTCEMCKEKRKCTKKLSIFKYPRILVIHIMRFRYSEASREKLSTDVKFPMRGLSLSPYLSVDRPPPSGTIPSPSHVAGGGGDNVNNSNSNDLNNNPVLTTGVSLPSNNSPSPSTTPEPAVSTSPTTTPTSPTPPPTAPTTATATVVEKNHPVMAGVDDGGIVARVEEVFHNLTVNTTFTALPCDDHEIVAIGRPMDAPVTDDNSHSHPASPTTQLLSSERLSSAVPTSTPDVVSTHGTGTKETSSTAIATAAADVDGHTIPTSSSSPPTVGVGPPSGPVFNADLFPPMYDLIGVSNHCGTLNGGHYVAHVDTNQNKSHHHKQQSFRQQQQQQQHQHQRNQRGDDMDTNTGMSHPVGTSNNNQREDEEGGHIDSRWVCFNDDHVSLASTSSVVGPSAYVLFYRLREH